MICFFDSSTLIKPDHTERGSAAAQLRLCFLNDLASGAINLVAVKESHYAAAEDLIIRHSGKKSLRTVDAIHPAVRLGAKARLGMDVFVVADSTLAEVAQAEGMTILNPDTTS